jgi:hypothetical protein
MQRHYPKTEPHDWSASQHSNHFSARTACRKSVTPKNQAKPAQQDKYFSCVVLSLAAGNVRLALNKG